MGFGLSVRREWGAGEIDTAADQGARWWSKGRWGSGLAGAVPAPNPCGQVHPAIELTLIIQ